MGDDGRATNATSKAQQAQHDALSALRERAGLETTFSGSMASAVGVLGNTFVVCGDMSGGMDAPQSASSLFASASVLSLRGFPVVVKKAGLLTVGELKSIPGEGGRPPPEIGPE